MLPRGLIALLATAVGLLAANLYYAQPLVATIASDLGVAREAAGLVVTLTQMGYGTGLLFAVPASDLVENKRLVLGMLGIAVVGLASLALAQQALAYFAAAFATGFGASCVQVIVPYAAHFTEENRRGQVVGQLMSGLMLGIMLSRPTASILTDLFSWHAVFVVSAVLLVALGVALGAVLPARRPAPAAFGYTALLASMWRLLADTPVLQRRAAYQALIFGAFCLFWTACPLLLASARFGLSQKGIAVFALVGVAGAVSAPLAGIAADRGRANLATLIGLTCGCAAFGLAAVATRCDALALPLLAIAAILVDAGGSATLVLGQRAIFTLGPELRGRLNALYIASAFVGGATGSAVGAWSYASGGWDLTAIIGFAMPAAALASFVAVVGGRRSLLDDGACSQPPS